MPDTTPSSSTPATSASSRASAKKADASGKPGAAAKSSAASTQATPARVPANKRALKKEADAFEAPAEAQWHRMISEAAYYRSESRGFAAGYADDDWTWAEEQVRKSLAP